MSESIFGTSLYTQRTGPSYPVGPKKDAGNSTAGPVPHLAGPNEPSESAQPAFDSSAALAGFLGRKMSELGSGGRVLLRGRASSAFFTRACLLTGRKVLALTTG
ncbi:MAG: hypothetical protein FRX49_09945 [Trebouxia sp. A1-2]|nr:MAG: hypothetical protein FRX49_09945 [Trebouxia sp. A1-2]